MRFGMGVVLLIIAGRMMRDKGSSPDLAITDPTPGKARHPEVRRRRSHRWIFVGPLLAVPVFAISIVAPIGSLPSENFYVVAAQIFPVLLVALAVEARMRDVWDSVPLTYRAPLVGSLLAGEVVAIVSASGMVASGSGGFVGPTYEWSSAMAVLTALALIVGFVGVVVVALTRAP